MLSELSLGSPMIWVIAVSITMLQCLVLLVIAGVWLFAFGGWEWVQRNLLSSAFDEPKESAPASGAAAATRARLDARAKRD